MPFCRLPDVCSSSFGSYSVIPSDVFVCSSTSSSSASSSTSLPSYLQATCILRFKVCLILSCLVLLALSCLVLSCGMKCNAIAGCSSSSKGRMRGRFYHRERFLLWRVCPAGCMRAHFFSSSGSSSCFSSGICASYICLHAHKHAHISTHVCSYKHLFLENDLSKLAPVQDHAWRG
jgi:hypothetical protein